MAAPMLGCFAVELRHGQQISINSCCLHLSTEQAASCCDERDNRVSTTPGNLRKLLPEILEFSWNLVDAPGKFYN